MLSVLIADDELVVCNLVKRLVNWDALGLQCMATATNGMEAYDLIQQQSPDIVITDIRMPGMTGLEMIERCAAQKSDISFVVISGYSEFNYARTALQFGVKDYLLKPIKEEELNTTLQRIAREKRRLKKDFSEQSILQKNLEQISQKIEQKELLELIHAQRNTPMNSEVFSWPHPYFRCIIIKVDFLDKHAIDYDSAEIILQNMLAAIQRELTGEQAAIKCKCYSKKGPKKDIIINEKSPTRPPKRVSVVG